MFLWTAFTIGLFGSLHCVGMCGPIAIAVAGQNRRFAVGNALLYNLGRVVTYSVLGAVIGLLGQGLFLAGFQKGMSVAMGVVLLIIAAFSINVETKLLDIGLVNRFIFQLKSALGRLLKKQGKSSAFGIGLLNGFLPCGLVYMGVFGALSTGSVPSGMAYMALFGVGTIPIMLLTGYAGNLASLRVRNFLKKLYPACLIFFARLFLLRGLNFHQPGDF
ncbi:MAG: sulfite exporter TauE/SafE family protein, partial [Saprospiraceae bacterium]